MMDEEEYLRQAPLDQSRHSGANDEAALLEDRQTQRRGSAISNADEAAAAPAPSDTGQRHAGLAALSSTLAPAAAGSAVTSLMRRMTTLRSPITRSRFRTTRRPPGSSYATLGEGVDADQYAVDLSSLAGLGYELRDVSARAQAASSSPYQPYQQYQQYQQQPPLPLPPPSSLDAISTEYMGAGAYRADATINKPSFQSFVNKRKSVGAGLDAIGAEIKPSASVGGGGQHHDDIDRSKTVRDLSRNLARERNQIVALDNAVDLSSLEGGLPVAAQQQQGTTQSYFFPDDPDVPNWKPFSMKTWYILLLMLLAFALAGVQEAVYQISIRRHTQGGPGGLLAFNSVSEVATAPFFAWKYLPTMVTIIYAVLFSIMDFDIRRLEPFYQLSQPSGANASASLNLDHLTMFQYFIPFRALQLRQWAVFFSSIGNIVASMAAPALQNPALQFGTNSHCQDRNLTVQAERCLALDELQYYVYVPPVWSRAVTAAYAVVGLILVVLLVQLRRKSGLLSDPKGIAGIAAMATKSHILRDFKGLDIADHGTIHRRLAHRRFVLYQSSLWPGEWHAEADEADDAAALKKSPQPPMLRRSRGLPFLAFMLFGLVGIALISLTPARAVPNAVPWLPVLLATLLKLLFSTFESDVRLMEPFYHLSRGNAPAHRSLTLDYQATVYGWLPVRALANGDALVALVGLASVSLDVLTVTVGSFSVDSAAFLHGRERLPSGQERASQDETFVSFWASLALSVAILAFVVAVTALVYARRSHAFLPREPSTIASVLAFIYASNMLTDFIDTERLTSRQMDARLRRLGKRYGLGWFRGRDGDIHCAIDEEPMKSRYVHGKPYTRAQARPAAADEPFYYYPHQNL